MRWIAFLAVLSLAGGAEAACPGRFSRLTKLAGEQPALLLRNPVISSRMAKLAGSQLAHLKANLSVASPIALIDCELVVEGNAPHRGGEQNAIVSFSLYDGIMTTAVLDGGRIVVRSTRHPHRVPANYSHLPAHVRDWIFVAANGFHSRSAPPTNVVPYSSDNRPPK